MENNTENIYPEHMGRSHVGGISRYIYPADMIENGSIYRKK
jgi:hypothetical protein